MACVVVVAVFVAGCDGASLGERVDGSAGVDARSVLDAAELRDAVAAGDAERVGRDGGPRSCPCFDGPGTYCEGELASRASSEGCLAPAGVEAEGARLYACDGDAWTVAESCAGGCEQGESGAADACGLPVCDCFVRVAWCGASAGRHGLTLDPPCRVPLLPERDGDLLGCTAAGAWRVLEACALGCAEQPTGTPDACVAERTPTDPGWADCPPRALLAWGLHPEASDRLRCAGVTAERISQTVGSAPASAGYHAADGTVDGMPYTAAVDLRTRDLSETEIRALLVRLGEHGFAAWYRKPGYDGWPSTEAPHIHAVFAGVVMKSALRGQVRDFLAGLNGLASHTTYRFWPPPASIRDRIRLLFSRHYTP